MEGEKNIKTLDNFTKKYVKEIRQEKVSIDFTASVMNIIVKESTSTVFKTKALISKKSWFVICLLVLAVVFIPFKTSDKNMQIFPKLDFSILTRFQIPNLFEAITISNTILYAVLLFGLMVIAQIFFLKNYFDKKYL